MSARLRGLLVMQADRRDDVYPPAVLDRLSEAVEWVAPARTREELAADPAVLRDVEVLATGWGAPRLDAGLLDSAPALRLVLVAAGTIREFTTEEFWARDIPIVSAASANAVPVVEFAFAQVVLGLKQVYRVAREARVRLRPDRSGIDGAYGTTVGIVSLGEIGRRLVDRLRTLDVRVVACDPFAEPVEGVELVSLEQVFADSDVVTLHTPLLPETTGMVGASLVASMRPGATLINTARGAIVDEEGMIGVLERRPDLTAVLDVTWPEPPLPGSRLRTLDNVVLTGHVAGSQGAECRRLGELVADEAQRFARGEPLRHAVDAVTALARA